MVAKYVRKIEEDGMSINSVPNLWREKVRKKVEADGYTFDENGHAVKVEVVDDAANSEPTGETTTE